MKTFKQITLKRKGRNTQNPSLPDYFTTFEHHLCP